MQVRHAFVQGRREWGGGGGGGGGGGQGGGKISWARTG